MDHYIEIYILPDPEFSASMLMNTLFAKLHRALVEAGNNEVGISFPQAQKTLGDRIRLHGNRNALQRLTELNWLKGLTDYTGATATTPVPDKCKYRIIKRVQAKSSLARMYRRSVKNGWLTEDEAEKKINASKEQRLKLPFLQLKSHSSGQTYRLFIQQGKLMDTPQEGKFSTYGLSDDATIPWF